MKEYSKILLVIAICFKFWGMDLHAQDGKALFEAKCSTCHALTKKLVGPTLQGVKQKWVDAKEGDMLYEWVTNSEALILSGKSSMAAAIKDFSPTPMSAQKVTNDEIDAILDYVDNYVEPKKEVVETNVDTEIVIVPNYEARLMLFYALCGSILFLLIALLVLSGVLQTILRSDQLKSAMDKLKSKSSSGGLKTLLLLIGFIGILSNTSFGLSESVPGNGGDQPWLLVETHHLYFLLAINIMLLGVVIYLKKMINSFMNIILEKTEDVPEEAVLLKRVGSILTDSVAIEEEHTILMEHEYDGIRELDNNLPPWWVWGFYATIIFAVVYLFNYHILKTGDLQIAEYTKDMKQSELAVKEYLEGMAMNVDESNVTLMTDASDLEKGSGLFQTNCIACHGPKGAGDIGPNLTDNRWIYGYDIVTIFTNVKNGTSNGMPEHKSKLNPIELQQVASYILTMPETSGKEAQGDIEEK